MFFEGIMMVKLYRFVLWKSVWFLELLRGFVFWFLVEVIRFRIISLVLKSKGNMLFFGDFFVGKLFVV